MSRPLYLLRARPDPRLLSVWIARHYARHARQAVDIGDALHGLMCAAFGDAAPQPFRYFGESRGLLAYTEHDEASITNILSRGDAMATRVLGFADEEGRRAWKMYPLPTIWPGRQVLGFEVRVRPTVRTAKCEQDAFVNAGLKAPDQTLEREAVYVQWLKDRLAAAGGEQCETWQGAAEILDARLASWKITPVRRRAQADENGRRPGHVVGGPDAVIQGRLRILDGEAFSHLVVRGVGRHRAFGFGMLLLRPAG